MRELLKHTRCVAKPSVSPRSSQHRGARQRRCYYRLLIGSDISLLAGLPMSTLESLQRVQNAAARLVFGLGRFDHVTPSLIQLHWLPVIYRVKFKRCCIIHAIYYGRSLTYLSEAVQSVSASRSRSRLQSASTSRMDYALPRLHTKFGERAFSHAGPATWNALPDNVRTVADPVKFRKLLKSHYFRIVFSVC